MRERGTRTLVSFDWAMKRLLRSPANFVVLEGFLSSLLRERIVIEEVLDSESLRAFAGHKQTRVDLRARDSEGKMLIIELQHERQDDFLSRMLFGSAEALSESLPAGAPYGAVAKVIAIALVYFPLGLGNDTVYHGRTEFRGLHDPSDLLALSPEQRALYRLDKIDEVFPEYYILRVNAFNDVAKGPLDEWLYVLKHSEVKPEFRAPGLEEAAQKLAVIYLSPEERAAYRAFEHELHSRASTVDSSHGRGKREGEQLGLEKGEKLGLQKGQLEVAKRLLDEGLPRELIARTTGLSAAQLDRLLSEHKKPQIHR